MITFPAIAGDEELLMLRIFDFILAFYSNQLME
jgi:hypothetical protein